MVLSLAPSVFAAEEPKITVAVDKTSVKAGETVTFTYESTAAVAEMTNLDVCLAYDGDVFEYVSVDTEDSVWFENPRVWSRYTLLGYPMFRLSEDKDDEEDVDAGKMFSVTFRALETITDVKEASFYNHDMQTEIEYDDTFLQLVESSVMTASGIRWNDLGRRTGGRAFYLNFVSFKGGESWEPEVLVGSFQMKVLGTSGVSSLTPVNTMVPTQDGMGRYAAEDNAVTVIVSTECTVSFESNGGTDVPSQTVHYGDKVKKPADPTRKGYHLEGWYSNLDRTEKWDFDTDV